MSAPLFITTEKKQPTLPLLIVDKQGTLSRGLISVLSEHFATVLVSRTMPLPHLSRVVHIPFRRSIPQIPDNAFSSLMVFYSGEKAIEDSLPSFIKKAKQNNAKLILITAKEHASLPFIQKGLESYDHLHILVYGDLFGISRGEDSLVTHMMHEAHLTKLITIHGSGLSESYPVYYADFLQGLLHMLLSHHPPRTGLVYPRNSVAEIHLARLILKLYPQADLTFVKETKQLSKQEPHIGGEYLLDDPYPLPDKLKHLRMPISAGRLKAYKRGKGYKKPRDRKVLIFTLLTTACLAMLMLSTFLFFALGIINLQFAVKEGKKGELTEVLHRSESASSFFSQAETTSGMIAFLGTSIGLGKQVTLYQENIRAAQTVASVTTSLSDAGITYSTLLKDKSSNPKESMLRITSDIKQVILGVSQLRAENSLPQTYAAQLAAFKKPLQQASGIIDALPQLVGVEREQRYLVLFQNNMELRPGGGFIGSYGLLTLRDGRMQSFTVHDVYDADGQLTGHVEPPYGLKRYLGAPHLFLRDSNFSVEFQENAAQAVTLLKASTDEDVDGVITMDVSFLRSLLAKIGPVYVPTYDETVSAKNFYLLVQSHAENDFFPGSSQKKDFIQHVAQALLLSFQDRDQVPYIGLLQAVEEGISQKHIMVTSGNPQLRSILATNNFSPSVRPTNAEKRAAISDFLGVFDANVGVNKANYYVTRALKQAIALGTAGERQGKLTLTYTNTSTPQSPFGGDYKNYLQLVLPQNTRLTNIAIDGVDQIITPAVTSERVYTSDRFTPPAGIEVDGSEQYGRAIFGMPFVVPMGQTKTLIISYTTTQIVALPETFTYMIRVFKQPGTDYDPYELLLTYPQNLIVTASPKSVGQNGQTLRVVKQLAEDLIIPITFLRK